MPLMFDVLDDAVGPRVAALDFLVALGTHAPMSDAQLSQPRRARGRGRPCRARRIFNHRWDDPATLRDARDDSGRRDRGADRRSAEPRRAGRPEPPSRVRPRHHLRAGLPARGGRLLRRDEVPLPGHRRRRDHPLHALARRAHHQLRRHRHEGHAGARGHRPCGALLDRAAVAPRAGRDARGRRGRLLRRPARGLVARRPSSRRSATSSGSTARRPHARRSCRRCTTTSGPRPRACTRWSRRSPTAAKSSSTPRTSREVSYVHGRLIDEIGYHCRDYFLEAVGPLQARTPAASSRTRRT